MLLSEQRVSKKWISQFDTSDQGTARMLLDHLVLVSSQKFQRDIQELILDTVTGLQKPIIVLPAREVSRDESYFPYLNDSQSPEIIQPNDLPGSEGIVAQIVRQCMKAGGDQFVEYDDINIAALRNSRCKSILIVDDLIGSGKRIANFLSSLLHHPSIRSWASLKYVQFFVIAYAATPKGLKKIERHKCNPKVLALHECPTILNRFSDAEKQQLVDSFCKKYVHKKNSFALGFRKSRGLLIFEHGVPNNTPYVIWGDNLIDKKQPLFAKRTVDPIFQNVFSDKSLETRIYERLFRLGTQGFIDLGRLKNISIFEKSAILILRMAHSRVPNEVKISRETELSVLEVKSIIKFCKSLGLIDLDGQITSSGKAVVRRARRVSSSRSVKFAKNTTNYYPKTLREAK